MDTLERRLKRMLTHDIGPYLERLQDVISSEAFPSRAHSNSLTCAGGQCTLLIKHCSQGNTSHFEGKLVFFFPQGSELGRLRSMLSPKYVLIVNASRCPPRPSLV